MEPDSLTAVDYLSSQADLERQARHLMPYDPKVCTFAMGPTRQQVYACLTCYRKGNPAGVCYSCSIQCHADHNLVELFTKRQFTCDCGTTRTNFPCSLRHGATDDIPESGNEYNHNYEGKFCHCARDYNPTEETGNMLQCILGDVCLEDWFHDYCIMGLPKFDPAKPIKNEDDGVNKLDSLPEPGVEASEIDDQDETEVAIDGFPRLDDFDCFICWKCVDKHREFFDKIKDNDKIVSDSIQRVEAPTIEERNQKITEQGGFFNALKKRKVENLYSLFLVPNHEDHFKKLYDETEDVRVKRFLETFPHLIRDDPIYEPPEDEDDDNSSIYDMGTRAINSLPREKAIEGVQVYETIKNRLKDFLTPFAQDGKIVNKEDIESFFAQLKKDKE